LVSAGFRRRKQRVICVRTPYITIYTMETTIFIHGSIGLIPPYIYIYGIYIYGIYIYGIYGGLMKKTGESRKKKEKQLVILVIW
jgi:hypothetical protein